MADGSSEVKLYPVIAGESYVFNLLFTTIRTL